MYGKHTIGNNRSDMAMFKMKKLIGFRMDLVLQSSISQRLHAMLRTVCSIFENPQRSRREPVVVLYCLTLETEK
ncbi:hypothetical protein pdam_00009640 [Pocillopora damicornis]|uniref:Uncharacterized protein n=1 Tax=Pocillopora damicornis TaxID=46731 RepID=A0A3M6UA92_POCDA|nr:hypothetical protein pdam_00009640 [Pocillopora damicornis]